MATSRFCLPVSDFFRGLAKWMKYGDRKAVKTVPPGTRGLSLSLSPLFSLILLQTLILLPCNFSFFFFSVTEMGRKLSTQRRLWPCPCCWAHGAVGTPSLLFHEFLSPERMQNIYTWFLLFGVQLKLVKGRSGCFPLFTVFAVIES